MDSISEEGGRRRKKREKEKKYMILGEEHIDGKMLTLERSFRLDMAIFY